MPLRIWRFGRRVKFLNKFWRLFFYVFLHRHTGIGVLFTTRLLYDWHRLMKSSSTSWHEEYCHRPHHRHRCRSCMQRHNHPESVASSQQTCPWQLPLFWPKEIDKSCLFTFINDKNGEMRLTTCMRSCTKFKSQDWNELNRIHNPVVLLVKKFCVCLPIPNFGVSKSKILVSHPPTQQIFAVCSTWRVPLRRPFFPFVAIFRRKYFRVDTACCRSELALTRHICRYAGFFLKVSKIAAPGWQTRTFAEWSKRVWQSPIP